MVRIIPQNHQPSSHWGGKNTIEFDMPRKAESAWQMGSITLQVLFKGAARPPFACAHRRLAFTTGKHRSCASWRTWPHGSRKHVYQPAGYGTRLSAYLRAICKPSAAPLAAPRTRLDQTPTLEALVALRQLVQVAAGERPEQDASRRRHESEKQTWVRREKKEG